MASDRQELNDTAQPSAAPANRARGGGGIAAIAGEVGTVYRERKAIEMEI